MQYNSALRMINVDPELLEDIPAEQGVNRLVIGAQLSYPNLAFNSLPRVIKVLERIGCLNGIVKGISAHAIPRFLSWPLLR